MTRKLFAMLLCAVMLLSLIACSDGGTVVEDTTGSPERVETQTETQTETEMQSDVTVSDALAVIKYDRVVPAVEYIGDADYIGIYDETDELYVLAYENFGEDELEIMMDYMAYCGWYPYVISMDAEEHIYLMIRPGSLDYRFNIYWYPEDEVALQVVLKSEEERAVGDELMQMLDDHFMQDVSFPSAFGTNVFPQFHASVGRAKADREGYSENPFSSGGDTCWTEVYNDIDQSDLQSYFNDMMMCGFEITVHDYVLAHEEEAGGNTFEIPTTVDLLINNGKGAVLLRYSVDSQRVTLRYQPGVDRYLLSGSDYANYIPQS